MRRAVALALVLAAGLGILGVLLPPVALALRLAFLVAGAPVLGAAVLLAIGRVVGAAWQPLAPLLEGMPFVLLLGLAASIAPYPAALPAHLALWLSPPLVTVRAALAVLALGYLGWRLGRGLSLTAAAAALALYAWLVTPVATDWLMRDAPAQPMSAAGMMLFVQQVAGACGAALLLGLGGIALRRDLARLLVAGLIGLGYLGYMDYLIVWFGNLPANVGFYASRTTLLGSLPVLAALVIGLGGPIALLWVKGDAGQRGAGGLALAGLFLFDAWWIGGGLFGSLLALLLVAALGTLAARRRTTHG